VLAAGTFVSITESSPETEIRERFRERKTQYRNEAVMSSNEEPWPNYIGLKHYLQTTVASLNPTITPILVRL